MRANCLVVLFCTTSRRFLRDAKKMGGQGGSKKLKVIFEFFFKIRFQNTFNFVINLRSLFFKSSISSIGKAGEISGQFPTNILCSSDILSTNTWTMSGSRIYIEPILTKDLTARTNAFSIVEPKKIGSVDDQICFVGIQQAMNIRRL
ncbi:MAG: hypothetical protein ACI8RD_006706 [Bacillariaceae sp.]|jgi:hypothetical protein